MRTISQRELRNDSGRVLRDLQDGEELLVTVNGTAVGVLALRPPPGAPQRQVSPEQRREILAAAPLTREQREQWRADIKAVPDPLDDPWARAGRSGGDG